MFPWLLAVIGLWWAARVIVTFYYMLKPVEMTGLGRLGNPSLMQPSEALFTALLAAVLCVLAYSRGVRFATILFATSVTLSLVMGLWPTIVLWQWATQHHIPVSFGFLLAPQSNHSYRGSDKTAIYAALPDGSRLALDVWPATNVPADQLRPAIVKLHGGAWVQGGRGQLSDWNEWFNQIGYDVFDVDYRMPPQGNWRDEVGDVKCALGWIATHSAQYHVDPARITLMGDSAGANLALLAAYSMGDPDLPPSCPAPEVRIRSVINIYGATEMAALYRTTGSQSFLPQQIANYIGGTPSQLPDRYRMLSPLAHVSAAAPPTLTIHGDNDRIVPVEQSAALDKALTAADVDHETYYLPWVDHNFDYVWNNLPSQIARAKVAEFLSKHLGLHLSETSACNPGALLPSFGCTHVRAMRKHPFEARIPQFCLYEILLRKGKKRK